MKKLAGTTWGVDIKNLKQVYNDNVRLAMEYGPPTVATAAKTNTQRLDERGKEKVLIQAEKYKRLKTPK